MAKYPPPAAASPGNRPGLPVPRRGSYPAAVTVDPQTEQAIRAALSHHQAGRLAEAERLYRDVLARYPDHPDVLHFLAAVAGAAGHPGPAVELLRRAIAVDPEHPDYHTNLASQLERLGRGAEAVEPCRRAVELRPTDPVLHRNLANVLTRLGRHAEAAAAFANAVGAGDGSVETRIAMGSAHLLARDFDRADAAYAGAAAADPRSAAAWVGLGLVRQNRGDPGGAVAAHRRAVELDPDRPDAWKFLSGASAAAGDFDGAVTAGRRATEVTPADAEAQWRYGSALDLVGEYDGAIAALERAIALRPAFAEPRLDLANALLRQGEFGRGWTEYEWRWRSERFPKWTFPPNRWDGGPLPAGRTLLVVGEQGFGDMFQFARYLPAVARRVAPGGVTFVCSPEVAAAMAGLPGVTVVSDTVPVPPHAAFVTLLSLPLLFGTTADTIPADVPYLSPDPARVERWRQRLGTRTGLRVGLVWGGRPTHYNNRNRSLSLEQFAPLGAAAADVTFYALQKGPPADQAATPPAGLPVVDLGPELDDFADTAAVLSELDLLVSADTAVVHLAGALGRPAWVLLPFVPDWRWLLGRDDSPWYPTLRLFRQPARGDWATPIAAVAAALRERVGG